MWSVWHTGFLNGTERIFVKRYSVHKSLPGYFTEARLWWNPALGPFYWGSAPHCCTSLHRALHHCITPSGTINTRLPTLPTLPPVLSKCINHFACFYPLHPRCKSNHVEMYTAGYESFMDVLFFFSDRAQLHCLPDCKSYLPLVVNSKRWRRHNYQLH